MPPERDHGTDPRRIETGYAYDARGLRTTTTLEGDTGTATDDVDLISAYDSNGNLTKSTDGRGLTTDYEYDKYDRLTTQLDHDAHYVKMVYDDTGLVVTRSSYNSVDTLLAQTLTAYDDRGRATKTSVYAKTAGGTAIATSGNYLEATRAYDDQGNLTSVTGPGGEGTTYVYDKANGLVTKKQDLTRPRRSTRSTL